LKEEKEGWGQKCSKGGALEWKGGVGEGRERWLEGRRVEWKREVVG